MINSHECLLRSQKPITPVLQQCNPGYTTVAELKWSVIPGAAVVFFFGVTH